MRGSNVNSMITQLNMNENEKARITGLLRKDPVYHQIWRGGRRSQRTLIVVNIALNSKGERSWLLE